MQRSAIGDKVLSAGNIHSRTIANQLMGISSASWRLQPKVKNALSYTTIIVDRAHGMAYSRTPLGLGCIDLFLWVFFATNACAPLIHMACVYVETGASIERSGAGRRSRGKNKTIYSIFFALQPKRPSWPHMNGCMRVCAT